MDKNREARRGVTVAVSNGLSRRRQRSSSLRDSPEEDGPLELQETARLRDRKKDRDRDRDHDRTRVRDRDRDRDRLSRSSKRRRSDKFTHGSIREDGGEDSSEESVNDDEDDDEDDVGGGGNSSWRMLPPNPSTSSSSMLNHHNQHHHYHHNSNNHSSNNNNNHSRKSFPPSAKVFGASSTVSNTTTTTASWKGADEMIGLSVPRKARSASTKRPHEGASNGVGVVGSGEQHIHRQASSSPVRPTVTTVIATPAPASPSSNVSVRKKMKPNGPKLRPPKSLNNKSSSPAQNEIEIEIAEVLYGMMRQPQDPSKQDTFGGDVVSRDTTNNNNWSMSDTKSRVSSPISNSPSTLPPPPAILPTNSSPATAPVSAIAPKRKRPRPVKYEDENPSFCTVRNSPISDTTKVEMDLSAKTDTLQNLENNSVTAAAENGSVSYDLVSSQASEPQLESVKPETNTVLVDSKALTEESESGGDLGATKEEPQSPKKESTAGLRLDDDCRDNITATKANSTPSEIENLREEKFQIDLMAPPPLRSSPERDGDIGFVAVDLQSETKSLVREDEKEVKIAQDDADVKAGEKKAKTVAEESESHKTVVGKERNIDLHLDLEKSDRDSGSGSVTGHKLHQQVQKQQPQPPLSVPEKTTQSNSLPLPLSVASWPGSLPPMGYMTPLQGVVSMDGSTVSSAAIHPPHLLFSQPRPKRCATHFYIARNIHYHIQFTKIHPFWPSATGSATLYGTKACNLNVVPPTEFHGNFSGRAVNNVQDKGQGLAIFPGHSGKDGKSTQPTAVMDAAQRKQVLLQQALPPGGPSNLLHAPAFIFPLSQQQAAAAASVRSGSVKSPPATSSAALTGASNSASVSATATAGSAATAMSFDYPNMPGNETQYLVLQNNAYPFPISAHVGAPPAYRGGHAQAMPFFNGSFYPSQMLHPSQLQQQQQQQQPLPTQSQQSQQGHQNMSISIGSSSQKHLQHQQQRPHNSGSDGSSGNLQGFPAPKNQPQLQLQQRQQQQNQQAPHQARPLESEMGIVESPSTAESQVSRANMSIYGQNFAMPLHPPNFTLMTTASVVGATSTSEKKSQQQQSSKPGVESLTPQTFAMTFASINGAATAPGLDISSIAQNPTLLQSLSEIMAAQQKKNYRVSEECKTGGNAPNVEEEKKSMAGRPSATFGQSIAFSRKDLTDAPFSAMTGNTVIDSSARTLNLGSVPSRTSVSVMPPPISSANAVTQQQLLQQQHQIIQLHKQQQFAAAADQSKTPATSNGSVYSDNLPSSSVAAKFPYALSVFPQNLVQSDSSPAQFPQWKNSGRTSTSQVTSPSLASSTSSSLKNLPQQQGRTPQSHTQISFAANPKSSVALGPSPPSNNQSASPPVMVGSPTTSVSKTSAGGSPRTIATTPTSNKGGQGSSLSSQQGKNSPSMPSRKSSPVPSILGNSNITASSGAGAKSQMSSQQQQQLSKHALQPPQPQLVFSNATYMQAQHAANATSAAAVAGGFFIQRHREQQPQQQPGSTAGASTELLSLCPQVMHSNTGTSDPAKAVAAASNMKGGGLPSQGLVHTAQFSTTKSLGKPRELVPPGFTNVHTVPTVVQVKPTEPKRPAGE